MSPRSSSSSSPSRSSIAPLLGTLAAVTFAGCGPRAGEAAAPDGSSSAAGSRATAAWPFWPVRVRVHPLTRLARDAEGPIVDLRLEFFDASGDTTRCSGEALIELAELPTDPAMATGTITMQWNLDLRELELNRTHFDDITRTYLIRLRPGQNELPEHSEIRVTFNAANGAVLRAAQRLE